MSNTQTVLKRMEDAIIEKMKYAHNQLIVQEGDQGVWPAARSCVQIHLEETDSLRQKLEEQEKNVKELEKTVLARIEGGEAFMVSDNEENNTIGWSQANTAKYILKKMQELGLISEK